MARKPTVASLARDLDTAREASKINFSAIASVGDRAAEIEKTVENIRIDHDARIATLEKEIIETVSDQTFGDYTDLVDGRIKALQKAVDPERIKRIDGLIRIESDIAGLRSRLKISLMTGGVIAAGLLVLVFV